MIVNVRGTSGSGKTWVTRQLMDRYGIVRPDWPDGERKPRGYYLPTANLYVVGSYESVCGGCDTITDYRCVLERIRTADAAGRHVLFEGLMVNHYSLKRWAEWLAEGVDYRAVTLDTPWEVCLERIRARRAARGITKPLNTANTETMYNDVLRAHEKMLDLGWPYVRMVSGEAAVELIADWLGQS